MTPLGTAFSRVDALKRQLYDMLTNPRDAAAMLGGRIVESGQQAQALQEQTFGDPNRPFRVTDPQAMARLTDMLMAGPMGFAPAGTVSGSSVKNLLAQSSQEVVENSLQKAFTTINPGDKVSGLTVRKDVPNMGSIGATFDNYEILEGIRKVPTKAFDKEYLNSLNPAKLDKRTADLSDQINQSKEINPLIVAIDNQGAYIVEGGHRFDALMTQKRESVPAVVVIDKDNPPTQDFLRSLLE